MEKQIYDILSEMSEILDVMQMKKLQKVLIRYLSEVKQKTEEISNEKYLEMFLAAKQIKIYHNIYKNILQRRESHWKRILIIC